MVSLSLFTQDIIVDGTQTNPNKVQFVTPVIRLRRPSGYNPSQTVHISLPQPSSDGDEVIVQIWADGIYVHVPQDLIVAPGNSYGGLDAGPSSLANKVQYVTYVLRWYGGLYYMVAGY